MDARSSMATSVTLALLLALLAAEGLARPQAPSAGKAPLGTAYDEIVVETHLAVRPKSPSVGVGLRRAKAVYFRPNATASGAEVRRITPLAASSSSTTTSPGSDDGISFAARVVGVENPLARASRARLAAAAERSRRESSGTPGGYSSSSSYSFKSSSSSKSSRSGPAVAVAEPVAAAEPVDSSSSSSTSSRSSSWTLPDGKTYSVHEDSISSQGPDGKPSSSTLLRVIIGDH
ncbi:uncharacterized protein LOC113207600 [Frankliniella occidentalis]|uniref:Uncharacterized protein LOC113207600 n=1 Tax=Frankliniella occidentalis TaxID=133901 RepID=A0A6J1SN96_FRAOC|nr:uncharacterized protein LOC113207600 [Frankliniella occidentalis]